MQNKRSLNRIAISVGISLGLWCDLAFWNQAWAAANVDQARTSAAQNKNIFSLIKKLRQNYGATEQIPLSADGNPGNSVNASSSVVSQSAVVGSRFAEGEEIIFDVSLQGYKLSELYAIKSATGYRVGFANLLEILDLPINFSLEQSSANGWFLREDNLVSLDFSTLDQLKAVIGGKTILLSADDYELAADDIYIELAEVSRWFNLTSQVNEEYLKLDLSTKDKLPVITRFERQNRKQVVAAYGSESVLPATGISYTPYSAPLVDMQFGVSHSSISNNAAYAVSSNQDLAYFNSELFVSGNTEETVQSVRFSLNKESAEGDLLPLIPVTRLDVGDVSPYSIGSASSGLSRGVSISNTPLNQLYDNRRVTIAGQVPVGWDVEVYRNGVLIDRAIAVSEGRYEFLDIELYFGKNEFEIVLYGPQGQVETRNENYVIDRNEVLAGQSFYNVSVVELNRSLFDFLFDDRQPNTGWLSSFVFNQGVTDWLAFKAGFSSFDSDIEESQQSAVVGVNLNLAQLALLNSSIRVEKDERTTVDSSLRTELGSTDWSFTYGKTTEDDPLLKNRDSERYGVGFRGGIFGFVNYANSYSVDTYGDGNETVTASNATSLSSSLGAISNSLIYQKVKDPYAFDELRDALAEDDIPFDENGNPDENLDLNNPLIRSERQSTRGVLSYARRFGSVLTRFSSAYQLQPERETISYSASTNIPISEGITTDLRFSYFPQFGRRQYGMGLSWRYSDFIFSAFGNYTDSNSYQIGLSTRLSFGAGSKAENYALSGKQVGPYGGAVVKVYEDKNLNQQHDYGEPLIKNARVKAVQANTEASTGSEGYAVLSGIVSNTKTDIVVDRSSLEDDRMVSTIPGFSISSRKGFWEPLELPVSRTAEIEGKVYFYDENEVQQPATYVGVHLINKAGETVNTTQTEYDGYYLFTDVLPGFYRVEIDKRSSRRKSLRDTDPLVFAVRGGVDILDGTTIVMQQAQLEPGYAVTMGRFNSAVLLKTYWSLVSKTGMNVAKLKPFYIQNDGKHHLYAGFYKDKTTADELCNRLAKRGFSCSVKEFEFKL
ncbi:MAG: SPOR domain-containing protein [Gammaproteobacteria bacterium]|nr:SPOR domain-containing protein [Gammaproteobacteria bacterium]